MATEAMARPRRPAQRRSSHDLKGAKLQRKLGEEIAAAMFALTTKLLLGIVGGVPLLGHREGWQGYTMQSEKFHCIDDLVCTFNPFINDLKRNRPYLQNRQIIRVGGHDDDLVPLVLRFQDGHQLPDAD
jgi:hypothetical protein